MGFFGNIFRTAVDTAMLPLSAAKDVVTLGGVLTDEEPATKKRVKKIARDLDGEKWEE